MMASHAPCPCRRTPRTSCTSCAGRHHTGRFPIVADSDGWLAQLGLSCSVPCRSPASTVSRSRSRDAVGTVSTPLGTARLRGLPLSPPGVRSPPAAESPSPPSPRPAWASMSACASPPSSPSPSESAPSFPWSPPCSALPADAAAAVPPAGPTSPSPSPPPPDVPGCLPDAAARRRLAARPARLSSSISASSSRRPRSMPASPRRTRLGEPPRSRAHHAASSRSGASADTALPAAALPPACAAPSPDCAAASVPAPAPHLAEVGAAVTDCAAAAAIARISPAGNGRPHTISVASSSRFSLRVQVSSTWHSRRLKKCGV
eukprot:233469-Chlamydomonas_euryale.AAC.1